MTAPPALDEATRRRMQRQPTRHTAPEMALRRALHALGVRYRLHHPGLPGRPDVALPAARIAVFVDGCFWHACPEHGRAPRNNAGWWADKLAANVARDRRKDAALADLGWLAVHVWEHEDPTTAAVGVAALWRSRRGSGAGRKLVGISP